MRSVRGAHARALPGLDRGKRPEWAQEQRVPGERKNSAFMTTRVVATPFGRSALAALRRRVAEVKGRDPLSPVTLLVPNHVAGVVARRYLAAGLTDDHAGVAGLTISTVER